MSWLKSKLEKQEDDILQNFLELKIELETSKKEIEYLKTFNEFLINQLNKVSVTQDKPKIEIQEVKGDE